MSNGLIQATSQGIAGTYKDGTIKVVITIEPTDAAEAFAILGTPGAPLVIGQLTQEAARADLQRSTAKEAQAPVKQEQTAVKQEEVKGGELAKWAGILSNDPDFWRWCNTEEPDFVEHCIQSGHVACDFDAREFILDKCGITSRRLLDHDKQAGLTFREEIMKPFHLWKEQQ